MWGGQVYMSGPEAWSSFQASLGTGTAHDRFSQGHKSGQSTHTGSGGREWLHMDLFHGGKFSLVTLAGGSRIVVFLGAADIAALMPGL